MYYKSQSKPGDICIYVNMDVYIWLLCRKAMGKSDLERIGYYVIGNRKEREAFDKFRDSPFYQGRPMLRTRLLSEFMNKRQIVPKLILKHGLEFITNFSSTLLDDLCDWTRGILYKKNDATNLTSSNSGIKILYVIYILYVLQLTVLRSFFKINQQI